VPDEDPLFITKPDPFATLRYKEFRSYLCMRFFLTFAYQMQAVIVGYYIYQLTKSALALGMIGLAEAIPSIGIALYGGYVADKSEKKRLLLMIFSVMWICSAIMLLATLPEAHHYLSNAHIVLIIYFMIFFIGLARGFYGPTAFSVMTRIIPRNLYPNSSTWNSSTYQTASVLGPLAGGLLFDHLGISVTFSFVVVFITTAIIAIITLNKHEPEFVPKESIYKSLSEGISFVFGNRMLLGALSLDLFSVFFGGVVALLPIFANDILKVGAEGFGLMRAADSVGAVLTMLAMTRFSPMSKPWRNLLIAVTGFGISIICFGFSKNFYLSLFCLFMLGAFDSVSVLIRSTIMQLLTPDQMRGRVSAVNSMFIGSSNEIGAFESGVAARLMGTVTSVIFGGSMTLIIVLTTYFKTKKLIPLPLNEINAQEAAKV